MNRLVLLIAGYAAMAFSSQEQAVINPNPDDIPIEIIEHRYFPAAGCDNGTPVPFFSIPAKNGAKASCVGSSLPLPNPKPEDSSNESLADFQIGTVIVLSASQEKLVLAADSRGTHLRGGRFAGYDDNACKILELNPKLLFAIAGMASTSPALPADIYFDAGNVARETATRFRFDATRMETNKTVKEIAEQWAVEMTLRIKRGVERGNFRAPGETWLTGIFAGLEPNGETAVAIGYVTYSRPRTGWTVPPAAPSIRTFEIPRPFTLIEAFGISKVAESYVVRGKVSDKARSEHVQIRQAQLKTPAQFPESIPARLVALTIKSDDDTRLNFFGPKLVGGEIDAAVLFRNAKVKWHHRKLNCSP
jgi:hypothetical protein